MSKEESGRRGGLTGDSDSGEERYYLEQGSASFFCKGSKYFQICVSYISDAITELCCCLMKAIMDNTYTNGQDLC